MDRGFEARNLIQSEQWRDFLESSSKALQVNLIFFVPDQNKQISVGDACQTCGKPLPIIDMCSVQGWDYADTAAVFYLGDYKLVVRDYACCERETGGLLQDKVTIAKDLLNNFLKILTDQWIDAQLITELATLRQINHILLAMFRNENNALDRVLDLILSAAVILFDASGSWLQYERDGQMYLLSKGDCTANDVLPDHNLVAAEISNPSIHGRIVIHAPQNPDRVPSFLSFMVQECVIAFEIDALLRLMESKISFILGAVDNFILLVDKRNTICYVNKAASDLLCTPVSDLVGIPIENYSAPWINAVLSRTDKVCKGIKDQLEVSEKKYFVDWQVYPLKGGENIPGWLIIGNDSTNYYKFQEMGERIEKIAATSNLMNVMAHEIRNPLSTFKGLLHMIDLDQANSHKYVERGLTEVKRLTLILDRFIQIGRVFSTMERVDLESFLENIIPLLQLEFPGEDFKIVSNFTQVAPVQIDKGQMTQVIVNLVKNAYESMNQQGMVILELHQKDDVYVEIIVRDSGPGIPEKIMSKLFKPYFSTKRDGSGFGLAIVSSIIQNHGGDVSVRNNPDCGASFSILLPSYNPDHGAQDRIDVLILTENDMLQYPVERVLKSENINTVTINRLDSLLLTLDRIKPSIVLLDQNVDIQTVIIQTINIIQQRYKNINVLLVGDDDINEYKNLVRIPKQMLYPKLLNIVKSILEEAT